MAPVGPGTSGIGKSRRDVTLRRDRLLIGLSTRWMGADEVDYRLGVCEGYLGHDDAALAAWGRLPARFTVRRGGGPEFRRCRDESGPLLSRRDRSSSAHSAHPGRQVVTVGRGPGPAPVGTRADLREASRDRVGLAKREPARLAQTRPRRSNCSVTTSRWISSLWPWTRSTSSSTAPTGRPPTTTASGWVGPTWPSATASSPTRGGGSMIASGAGRRIRRSGRPSSTGAWRPSNVAAVRRALAHLPAERFSASGVESPPRLAGRPSPRRHDRGARSRAVGRGRARRLPGAGAARRAGGPGRSSRAGRRAPPAQGRDGPGPAALQRSLQSESVCPTTLPSSLGWPRPWVAGSKPSAS